jgi:hypothetical protein
MANVAALTLANICMDVQIDICMYLLPLDILVLRKVCQRGQLWLIISLKYYQDL